MPNVFMGVAYDTPDLPYHHTGTNGISTNGFDVHSKFKQPPAARLARAGLALAYGIAVDTTTPLFAGVERSPTGAGLLVNISNAPGGLLPLRSAKGFEVLSNDYWVSVTASAVTSDGRVQLTDVPDQATRLRYNWYSNPCGYYCFECAVYARATPIANYSGEHDFLPLPPFQTGIPARAPVAVIAG